MKTLLALIRFAMLACVAVVPMARGETFYVPVEVGNDSLTLYQIAPDSSLVQKNINLTGVAGAYLTYETETALSSMDGTQVRLWNNTMNAGETLALAELQGKYFTWWDLTGSGASAGPMSFGIPEARLGHVFALYDNGAYIPVTTGGVVSTSGHFTARAYKGAPFSPSDTGWYLLDVTTQEVGFPEASLFSANGGGGFPLAEVTVICPDNWQYYTLHTEAGSLTSLWSTDDGNGNYVAYAQVPWGQTYWISRDIDGAQSSSFFSPANTTADIRPSMQPYVERNLISSTWIIGEERNGHQFEIVHDDGFTTTLQPDGNTSMGQYWDDDGISQYIYPVHYSGQYDANRASWYLRDATTNENLGMSYQVFNLPGHPNPPGTMGLYLPESRVIQSHTFRMFQDNLEEWNVPGATGSPNTVTVTMFAGTAQEKSYDIAYYYGTALYSPADNYRLRDNYVGDYTDWFSYSGSGVVDLSQWYLPKVPVNMRINPSRWFNQLFVVQPNTQEAITKGNLQGTWEFQPGGWVFTSSDFYDANAPSHPDAVWWLWDATRQEYLVPDSGTTTDFLDAYDGTDTDGDLLPDWWERTRGTAWQDPDSDDDGMTDYDEYMQSRNPHKKDNYGVVKLSVTGFAVP